MPFNAYWLQKIIHTQTNQQLKASIKGLIGKGLSIIGECAVTLTNRDPTD